MNKIFKPFLISAALLCSSVANAALITDSKNWGAGTGGQFVDYGLEGFTFSHDLTGLGFKPGVSSALSGTLVIELTDDNEIDSGLEFGFEFGWPLPYLPASDFVTVIVESFNLSSGGFGLVGTLTFLFDASSEAIAAINGDGMLDIIVRGTAGLDDFYINSSTLTLEADNLVPAPATLALFGLGLLGLGAVRQRSKS